VRRCQPGAALSGRCVAAARCVAGGLRRWWPGASLVALLVILRAAAAWRTPRSRHFFVTVVGCKKTKCEFQRQHDASRPALSVSVPIFYVILFAYFFSKKSFKNSFFLKKLFC
jgi:hypothetical protein